MPDTILLVDDNPRLLAGTRLALEMNGYTVLTANDGNQALSILERTRPALIVSDILMPGCDGFSLLNQVHAHPEWVTIPFLFLTALDDQFFFDRGREMGADDYLTKPFTPGALVSAVQGRLDRANTIQKAHLSESNLETILVMANAIEARDLYTGKHLERVANYAIKLAQALGWLESQIEDVNRAAVLHDIGKVAIPDAILNKACALTAEEWQIMKTHPVRGVEILSPLGQIKMVLKGVRHHHEQYNGEGYPDGLAGAGIPAIGRLLAVVDAYDAMTSKRAYRLALSRVEAVDRLRQGSATQFDPGFVDVFIHLLDSHVFDDLPLEFTAADGRAWDASLVNRGMTKETDL